MHSPVPGLITHNERTAENRLREISIAVFKEIGGGFYPDTTFLIGGKAECNPGFYDHLQYLLRPEDGYIFDYRTVTSEASVRGCTVARSYRITARPIAYRKTGIRSFLVYQNEAVMKLSWPDEGSISVHATSETGRQPLTIPMNAWRCSTGIGLAHLANEGDYFRRHGRSPGGCEIPVDARRSPFSG
jgi:hypothetical protein